MHFDSERPDSHPEFELRRLRIKYLYLGDLIHKLSFIVNTPLRLYLVSSEERGSILLFCEGDFSICGVDTEERDIKCDCEEELNRWLKLTEIVESPVFVKCRQGYSIGLTNVNINCGEGCRLVLVMGPIPIDLSEQSIGLIKFPVIREGDEDKTIAGKNHVYWQEQLIYIKSLLESFTDKEYQFTEESIYAFKGVSFGDDTKLIDYFHLPFDTIRGNLLWSGITLRNSRLIKIVLLGKGEELWNYSNGKIDSVYMLCSWVESILFRKILEERLFEINGFSRLNLKLFLDSLPKDMPLNVLISKIVRKVLLSTKAIDKGFKNIDYDRFRAMITTLEKLLWANPHLHNIAKDLKVRDSALSHWLMRKTGLSYEILKSYLQVEICAKYLRNSKMSLGAIGKRIGIDLESQLSMKFKRCTGLSPSEYRKIFGSLYIFYKK